MISLRPKNRDRFIAILMIAPSVILIAIFVYGFIGQTAYSSMTDWQGMALNAPKNFVGLANYKQLFTGLLESRFRQGLVNTFFFTIFFMLICLVVGLLLAILLDQEIKYEGVFRTIFLYPMALSFIVTGTVWRWLLNPTGGINRLPTLIGLPLLPFKWITSREQIWQFNWQDLPMIFAVVLAVIMILFGIRYWRKQRRRTAYISGGIGLVLLVWALLGGASRIVILPSPETHGFNLALIGIIFAAAWQMIGYTMAMYLAGLRSVPNELREAAVIDGASVYQTYRHIILPILSPITLSAMIILGHISLKIFDLIFVMSGPDNATTDVPGILMFVTSFRGNQFAKGAAIAMVMFFLVAVVVVPYLITSLRSEVEL
jgi:glucose/mannose transport system permease protein